MQLAFVIIRLYETDPDRVVALTKQLLCQRILGFNDAFNSDSVKPLSNGYSMGSRQGSVESFEGPTSSGIVSADPFLRSIAYWHIKEYHRALETLVSTESANDDGVFDDIPSENQSNHLDLTSDVFNFYIYLRRHPLVIRQKLAELGITVGTTEAFLKTARQLETEVSPAERKLFFKVCSHISKF